MKLLPLGLVCLLLPSLIWAQSGVNARNQGGDSNRASNGPGYVEIPPDIPPENFFSLTYHPSTPNEGLAGWYDVRDGDGFAKDFRREWTVTFQEVEMSFPVFFCVDRKEPRPPFPSPQFSVSGASELDSRLGRSPVLPYTAFYISQPILNSTQIHVIDHLKSYMTREATEEEPARYAYRWSLGSISEVEPIAITSSLLFKLPTNAKIANEEYGIIVPFSQGGNHLSSIDPETDRPIYHPRLRAVYLHKPDHLKTRLSWQPAESLQVWHTPFKARSDGGTYFANGFIPEGKEFVHKDDTNPVFLEATSKNPHLLKWGLGGQTHSVQVIPVDLAVDANRDGVIKFAGNLAEAGAEFDQTTHEKPFRFWLNNDNDGLPNSEGEFVPATSPDYADGILQTARDLEDLARLWIYLGNLHEQMGGGSYQVSLSWRSTGGTSPKIKVYRSTDSTGSDSYLKSPQAAINQISGDDADTLGEVAGSTPLFLDRSGLWTAPQLCLLFEGSGTGRGELVLTFWKDGEKIGEGPGVWIDLVDVKKMYQSSEGDMFAGAPPDEAKQTLVSVHGWNMSPEGSRNYAETMFKRLWHRGFKGRFAYFRWNTYWITATDVIGTLTTQYFANYNNSEYIAWTQGAPALKAFVASLPYQSKNIAAHSMGNIVVGEAMRLGMQVNNYALMQPAVPAACYDEREVLKQTDTYDRSFLGVGVTMWDEASPDEDPDTATRNMSYRGMLKDIGQNGNLILFYLPNDAATSNAWELNNDLTKPSGTLSGHFRYERNAPAGQKLYRDFGGGVREYSWSSRRESASYACRTWGKAAGADGRTEGSVRSANRVNLGNSGFQLPGEQFSGFGDEHSGQFTARIQQLKPFYDELMRRLDIGDPNP